jgi:hypothetical protein
MTISEEYFADVTANGDSDWVKVESAGLTLSVDVVDGSGDSAAWGAVEATLLYSPDGKMRAVVTEDGTAVSGTDGFVREAQSPGYYAIAVTGISGETVRIKTQNPRDPFRD